LMGGRAFYIQPAVASQGKGLREGLTWLAKNMKPNPLADLDPSQISTASSSSGAGASGVSEQKAVH